MRDGDTAGGGPLAVLDGAESGVRQCYVWCADRGGSFVLDLCSMHSRSNPQHFFFRLRHSGPIVLLVRINNIPFYFRPAAESVPPSRHVENQDLQLPPPVSEISFDVFVPRNRE